jgi:hypothetical protein
MNRETASQTQLGLVKKYWNEIKMVTVLILYDGLRQLWKVLVFVNLDIEFMTLGEAVEW